MSDSALTTLDKVVARLEDGATEGMESMIGEYIEDASDQARHYGNSAWSATNCPDPIRRLVAMVVARFVRNPDAYSQSRAGDETLGWQELPADFVGTVYFTNEEIERLQRFGSTYIPAFGTMKMSAYQNAAPASSMVWQPTVDGRPFPLFQRW